MARLILHLSYPAAQTRIWIEPRLDLSLHFLREINTHTKQIILFFDDALQAPFIHDLQKNDPQVLLVPVICSEVTKSRQTKQDLEDLLISKRISKQSIFIALGGGVLTDLIGFLASTYMRGVDFIIIPTTLLCIVDACIGGKTGINALGYKNAIGTFYPAKEVIIDRMLLNTLPEKQWTSAVAEVIKYSLIASDELFTLLKNHTKLFYDRDPLFIDTIIKRSIEIKIDIVEEDPWDIGKRRILNFGHTIGHAIETVFDFTLTHGQAIAAGMCMEAFISFQKGYLQEDVVGMIYDLFLLYRFDFSIHKSLSTFDVIDAMTMDKKASASKIFVTCLDRIGNTVAFKAEYVEEVSIAEIEKAIDWFKNKQGLTDALTDCLSIEN